ncbi:hypothetical protein R3P38DRAFT_2770872 [Favolaschia claudopus]|uniref:Uncharacterized protein n=1 Tax=Favolaschia claudopus TaxID=2862362 RepID=A0AAW0CII2_9AGAR
MVETKRVPNSLQISLVSPQIPEQLGPKACHTEYTRQPPSTDVKVWDNSTTRTLSFGKETADQAIQQGNARGPNSVPRGLAILPGNPLTDSVKEGPETVEFSPRLTPREGIQPKILGPKACDRVSGHLTFTTWVKHCVRGHTECTRQPPSTDVKVCDNHTAQTLRFGKETADQAIQQGNARVNNGIQQDIGELAAQTSPPSTIADDQPSLPRGYNDRELRVKGRHKLLESAGGSRKPSYGNGEFRAQFRATGPRIHGNPLPDFETAHSIERNPLPPCENVLELSGIHCHPVKSRLKWVESTATLESTAHNKLTTFLIAERKAL